MQAHDLFLYGAVSAATKQIQKKIMISRTCSQFLDIDATTTNADEEK
jgi:hypothetical protein